uniref:Putative secreted protein n=1 Tax=Ixodes scapularis TaxID=6945 RepID=A0A4D5RBI4_IXOSC
MRVPPAPHPEGPFAFSVLLAPFESIPPSTADVEPALSPAASRKTEKSPLEVICSRRERCPSFSRSSILAARPNCTIGLTSTQWILPVARKNSARCSTPRRVPEVSETLRWFFFFFLSFPHSHPTMLG